MWPPRKDDWWIWTVIIVAAIAAVACLIAAICGWPLSTAPRPQLGTLADWFAAIGTISAFIAGLAVIRRDNKWKRDEEERRHHELEHRQAELITGWWDDDANQIEVINNSTGIAHRVIVTTGYHLRSDHPDCYIGKYNGINHAVAAVPPGKSIRIPAVREYSDADMDEGRWLQIRFTDDGGRHWFRGGAGELKRADEDPVDFLHRVAQSWGIDNIVDMAKANRRTEYRPKQP